ncbi:MAG: hypothetical protein ACE14L_00140 [Terriglobales bacterium]
MRDPVVLAIFESADDALQGTLAYHLYVKNVVRQLTIPHELLDDKRRFQFEITHEWARNFEVGEFFRHISDGMEFQHCRTMLLAILPYFEVALRRIKRRLYELGKLGTQAAVYSEPDYKPLLKWAFQTVQNTQAGSPTMRQRLPQVCGDIDNARRLRNCSVHDNNYFNESYTEDVISEHGVQPQFLRNHAVGQKIFLTNARIEYFFYSHIEFLHMFHNTVQRKFFQHDEDYNYEREGKTAELWRMIAGRADVRV